MKIAFLGLGTMGGPMARNLIKGGHALAVFDVAAKALEPFRSLDCRAASTPADVARPVFECLGDSIVHAGPQGHGIKLKLVNNYMSTVGSVLAAEALTLANKAGLDREMTVRVLSGTTAGRGQLIVNFPNKVLAGDVTPDFPLRMAHKDVSHALALGAELGSPLMLGSIAREMFSLAGPWGRGNEDWTATLLLLEDLARAEHLPPTPKTRKGA